MGPRSAGSMPGPACFNLGGTEPTVTDADVVLGYINPEYYYGGKMRLDKNRSIQAIREKIAKPLGVGVEEAATIIRKIVNGNMASAIMKEVHLRGYSPEEFILFVGGGAGATHAEGFKGDIRKAVTFPFSPVFCAFGSSTMDIMHVYEVSKKLTLMAPGTQKLTDEFATFNATVEEPRRAGPKRSRRRWPRSAKSRFRPRTGHALRRPVPREARSLPAPLAPFHRRRPHDLRRLQQGIQRSVQPLCGKSRGRHFRRKFHPESHRHNPKSRDAEVAARRTAIPRQPEKPSARLIGPS